MSQYGDKVAYGKAPIAFNPKCIDDPQVLGEYLNQLAEAIFVMGGPYVPTSDQAATIPPTHPARNRVRFRLTEAIGATTTKVAAAVAVDGDGTDIAGAPAFNVVDSLNRYPAAGSGKYGWAEYMQYPDDTYRFEIVSLGGEGTVTGSGDDEKAGVTVTDTPGYLLDKMYAAGGWSPPGYDGGIHQAVWFESTGSAGNEFLVGYTSKQSAVETYTVKVSGADTTESYLQAAFTAANHDTAAFNATDHQRVYFRIDTAGGNETLAVYIKRSEDTGKVKVRSTDTLAYLEEQFSSRDDGGYNANAHIPVFTDSSGVALQPFIKQGKTLLARLTADVPARSGTTLGSATGVTLFTSSGGTLASALTGQTVYNPKRSILNVSGTFYVPVTKMGDDWVLFATEIEQTDGWEPSTEMHIRQCSSDAGPKFSANAPLTDFRVTSTTFDVYNDCDGWVTKHTGEAC